MPTLRMDANQLDSSTPPNLGAHTLEPDTSGIKVVKMEKTKANFPLETKKVHIVFENGYNSTKSQIHITWTKFCDNTKLAGLHLIGGHRKGSIPMRLLLLIIWLTGLACSSYKCSYCLNVYLNKDVKTKITYDSMVNLQFPAITFCHVSGLRKSILGINKDLISLISHIMVRRQEELPVVVNQNKRICSWNNQSTESEKKMAEDMKQKLINLAIRDDFEGFYRILGVDSISSVNKCWWGNRETNCSNLFLNHQIENNICFTFNQNPIYIDSNKGSFGVAIYGMDTKHYKEKTVDSYGPSSSLKLLLNVHQEEYCVSLLERFGAGFRVFVHDTRSQASLNLDSSISISPGYDHTVTLKPVLHDRRNFTERLGNCVSYVYNFMKPNLTDYNQESCFASCFAKSVFDKCRCLAISDKSPLLNAATAKYLGIEKNRLKACFLLDDDQRNCFAEHMVFYLSQNSELFCPECKRSCFETDYDFQITAKRLSSKQIASIQSNADYYINASKDFVQKNSLMVSFMFEDKNLITIREVQAFTSLNLYMAIGGILGLFLGFSTISLYEVVHYLLLTIAAVRRQLTVRRKTCKKSLVTPVLFTSFTPRNRKTIKNRKCPLKRQVTSKLTKL